MIEGLILGMVQGITEWLPISSEGVLTLVGMKFFGKDLSTSVSMAVFLHLGTFLAALFYFRKDVRNLLKVGKRRLFLFLVFATLVTALVGTPLFIFSIKSLGVVSSDFVIGLIGFFLIITGLIQFKKPEDVFKTERQVELTDSLIAGASQGLAVLPGFSRSGLTTASLLFRKFKDTEALKLSFLMSLPAVLFGNIALTIFGLSVEYDLSSFVALATSFVVGLFAISFLLKISRKINFGKFVVFFGLLTLLGAMLL